MQTTVHSIQEITEKTVKQAPCVSIILPFEPKMYRRSHLENRLQKVIHITEKNLLKHYPAFTVDLLTKKLTDLVRTLEYSTYKKSIVLNVSPDVQKIFYLDIDVEEKIIIGESFDTRNIVLSKRCHEEYLLLLMGTVTAKVFHVRGNKFTPLINNHREHIKEERRTQQASSVESDLLTRKFIHHVEDGLAIILKAYPVPLILACTVEAADLFRQYSKMKDHVIKYIPGNYEHGSSSDIKQLMDACENDWRKIKENYLLFRVGHAFARHKCSIGIKEVFKIAFQKRGIKLIVEKNYAFPGFTNESKELKGLDDAVPLNSVYLEDAVNEVIEKVLENSGDVEFVSDGLLKDYMHVALVHYY
jgi:hypothetical protein